MNNKDRKFLTDKLKDQFIELVFKKHPNPTFVYMVKTGCRNDLFGTIY